MVLSTDMSGETVLQFQLCCKSIMNLSQRSFGGTAIASPAYVLLVGYLKKLLTDLDQIFGMTDLQPRTNRLRFCD